MSEKPRMNPARRSRNQRTAAVAKPTKLQAPSSKLQRNSKHQAPKQPFRAASDRLAVTGASLVARPASRAALGFGVWDFSGAWCLELGALLIGNTLRLALGQPRSSERAQVGIVTAAGFPASRWPGC